MIIDIPIRNRPACHRLLRVAPGFFLVALLAVIPATANQIWPSDDSGFPVNVFTANEVVYVTGDLDMTSEDGYFYSARVYITKNRDTWIHGQGLSDVSGSYNVVIGNMMGSGFMGETAWLPMLVPGYYDIVLDENKNGIYDCDAITGTCDVVLGDPHSGPDHAFAVLPSTGKPVVDKAAIKAGAQDLANRYYNFPQYLQWSTTALDAAETTAEIVTAASTGELVITLIGTFAGEFIPVDYNDAVMDQGQQIIENLCAPLNEKYQALANDPPDPDFMDVAELGEVRSYPALSGEPLAIAQAQLASNFAEQEALVAALTRSLEKLDGALAADDDHGILLQAGYVQKYADLLRQNYGDSIAAIDGYKGEIAARGGNHIVSAANITALRVRVLSSGFSAPETERFKKFGMDDADIASLRQQISAWDTTGIANFNEYQMWEDLASSLAAADADALGVFDDAGEIVMYYGYSVDADHPDADAGGPYSGTEGAPVQLDGTGSTDPDGDPLGYAWDCDGDGEFDDASGPVSTCSWDQALTTLVGLRVTDGTGLTGTSYAKVTILPANGAPVAVSVAPSQSVVVIGGGRPCCFPPSLMIRIWTRFRIPGRLTGFRSLPHRHGCIPGRSPITGLLSP